MVNTVEGTLSVCPFSLPRFQIPVVSDRLHLDLCRAHDVRRGRALALGAAVTRQPRVPEAMVLVERGYRVLEPPSGDGALALRAEATRCLLLQTRRLDGRVQRRPGLLQPCLKVPKRLCSMHACLSCAAIARESYYQTGNLYFCELQL